MKNLGIISSVVIIISVFLPWENISSFSTDVQGNSNNVTQLIGISTIYGFFGIVLGSISFWMFFRDVNWSFVPGFFIIYIGVIFLLEKIEFEGTSSITLGHYYQTIKYDITPNYGIFIFIISGILCFISGLKLLKIGSNIRLLNHK